MDRLVELTGGEQPENIGIDLHAKPASIEKDKYSTIAECLVHIQTSIAELKQILTAYPKVVGESERDECQLRFQKSCLGVTNQLRIAKQEMDVLQKANEPFKNDMSTIAQVKNNMARIHFRSIQKCAVDFSDVSYEFKRVSTEIKRRQLRNHKIPDKIIDKIISKDGAGSQMSIQAILQETLSGDTESVIRSIQSRHQSILGLEESIHEIQALFMELSMHVNEAQETLDSIELHVNRAHKLTDKGEQKLLSGHRYQVKENKRKWCVLIIMIIVVLVISVPLITR